MTGEIPEFDGSAVHGGASFSRDSRRGLIVSNCCPHCNGNAWPCTDVPGCELGQIKKKHDAVYSLQK